MIAATLEEISILRHMVGADQAPRNRGFRNYYAISDTGDALLTLLAMEAKGLVRKTDRSTSGMNYFRATALGCEFTGIDKAAQRRALAA